MVALTGRGERTRASGPVERVVRRSVVPPPTPDQRRASLHDLVSTRQIRRRDRQTERLRRLLVDNQLERRRLLDRQIGRLGTPEDLVDIDGSTIPGRGILVP
jgi:hypothetical protein